MIKIEFLARKFLYFLSPRNTFMGKGKDPDPDLYLWPTDPDADPGGPKHTDPDPEPCEHVNDVPSI
jgi:hypothetical protein